MRKIIIEVPDELCNDCLHKTWNLNGLLKDSLYFKNSHLYYCVQFKKPLDHKRISTGEISYIDNIKPCKECLEATVEVKELLK